MDAVTVAVFLYYMLKEKTANQEYFTQQSYPSRMEERERFSQNKQELREFITARHVLQEILKGVIQVKIKEH